MSLLKRLGRVISSYVGDIVDRRNQKPTYYGDGGKSIEETLVCPKEAEYRANLEVGQEASIKEIRLAYKRLLKTYHPDLHGSDVPKQQTAKEITQRLNEAMSYFEKMEER